MPSKDTVFLGLEVPNRLVLNWAHVQHPLDLYPTDTPFGIFGGMFWERPSAYLHSPRVRGPM